MVERTVLAVLLCLAAAAPARAQELDGTWQVTWAQGIRVDGGALVEVTGWGEAELRLQQTADSVSGTWARSVEGLGGAQWIVRGTFHEGRLELTASEWRADAPALGRELSRIESLHWEGTLVDGRLEGEMWLVVPEMGSLSVRRPWSAERRPRG